MKTPKTKNSEVPTTPPIDTKNKGKVKVGSGDTSPRAKESNNDQTVELEIKITSLKQELQTQKVDYEKRVQDLEGQIYDLRNEEAKLKGKLAYAKDELEDLKEDRNSISEMKAEAESLRQKITELERQRDELLKSANTASKKYEDLRTEKAILEDKVHRSSLYGGLSPTLGAIGGGILGYLAPNFVEPAIGIFVNAMSIETAASEILKTFVDYYGIQIAQVAAFFVGFKAASTLGTWAIVKMIQLINFVVETLQAMLSGLMSKVNQYKLPLFILALLAAVVGVLMHDNGKAFANLKTLL